MRLPRTVQTANVASGSLSILESQLVTKTDLAKYEHSWSQRPHIVSRGAQKCYLDFMDGLDQRGVFEPDERYFERAMARAILF